MFEQGVGVLLLEALRRERDAGLGQLPVVDGPSVSGDHGWGGERVAGFRQLTSKSEEAGKEREQVDPGELQVLLLTGSLWSQTAALPVIHVISIVGKRKRGRDLSVRPVWFGRRGGCGRRMVEGRHGGAAGGRHWAGDLHHCGRLLLVHTAVNKKSACRRVGERLRFTQRSGEDVWVLPGAHLKLYGHFPPYWSLNCCSWKQLELSSEHGLCSSRFIFSCSPWKATRFRKTKAEVRHGKHTGFKARHCHTAVIIAQRQRERAGLHDGKSPFKDSKFTSGSASEAQQQMNEKERGCGGLEAAGRMFQMGTAH